MTRRQQISDAAQVCDLCGNLHELDCFAAGAKWADAHPCMRTTKGARPCKDIPLPKMIRLTGVELLPRSLFGVGKTTLPGDIYLNPHMIGFLMADADESGNPFTEVGLKNERRLLVKETVEEILEMINANR